MPRHRKPKYFRSLVGLAPGIFFGGAALLFKNLDDVRCSVVPATVTCLEMVPAWGYLLALLIVVASIVWTSWAWYKDHVRGEYQLDVMMGADGHRD